MQRRELLKTAGLSLAASTLGPATVLAQAPAGRAPREVLLLIEKSSHCISHYDIASGERLHTIALPPFPHEFVVDAAQRYAYVGHYGVETSGHPGPGGTSVLQIDLATRTLARTIDLAPFNRLHGIQMDQSGRLYVLSEDRAQLAVLDRPETDTAVRRAVPVGGIKSHLFALTRDGQTAYAMNLLTHSVTQFKPHDAAFAPVACVPGDKPEGNALSADERTLYVTCRWSNTLCAIDTATMKVVRSAPARNDPTRIYRCRDGRLLVSHYGDRSLSIVDPATLAEQAHIPMDARPIAVSLHPTRPWAFVSQDNDRVGIFHLESRRFERSIATQREPDVSYMLQG
ncbi:YncE family protein [Acidovorax sp. SUPP950]|uniref:YncE family protein n=1 Tax=Acidovorax sp. SUPP950 TaxID=511901 RepID=UPI0023D3642A|nr:YncE family protein [Acidovorax sp. SUPP950]GKS76246.1 YncE family protein [Acidovorax sp. SUPP950]